MNVEYAASCRSRWTGEGSGLSNILCVRTTTVRSRPGSTSHDVPKPPSQP